MKSDTNMKPKKFFTDRRWVLSGIIASVGFGLWGFLDKFSTSSGLAFSNVILYGVALFVSCIVATKYRCKPSKNALITGICSGMINILVLYSLLSNMLILVFPFVSFGTIWFSLLYIAYFKPSYSRKRKIYICVGTMVSISGLVLISFGISGGSSRAIGMYSFDPVGISLGIVVSIFTGLWTFFTFLTTFKDKLHPLASAIWIYTGSFVLALCALLLNIGNATNFVLSRELLFPLAGGFFIFIGQIATSYGFRYVESIASVDQFIIAFFANGELLPILFLSYFVLHEFSYEGFIGAALVFGGLFIVNRVRTSEN